ncbi:MAG: molybdate ABC transporter substrate-binding protein [Rhizobiaceae bacterium]|nr:molybdate ABC transporter substrate-binding protein [Rhizobiaceae bacterium]
MRGFLAAIAIFLCVALPARAQEPVTVFAAASLKTALDAISESWSQEEGRQATVSYAGSSALARQIEEGAPADLFISADLDWMAYLTDRDLIDTASERRLLGNRIVLVAPADSSVELSIAPGFDLAGALGDGRLAMANIDAVPAGRYGKAALESLGVWDGVADKVAQAENVRAALQFVALGEAPLGIVYQTDATVEPGVRVVGAFPEDSHEPIIYPAALTVDSANPDAAAFLNYLQGDAARAIFEEQGFTVLAGD